MPIEFIIIFIFLAVIALIGAACLVLLLKGRKKGETQSIDDEMIDTVNKNIYDAKNELKNVIERESMALGAIVKTSAETMNSSAANNWANLQTAVKEQLKTSGENSEKRLGELIASEKESSDRLEISLAFLSFLPRLGFCCTSRPRVIRAKPAEGQSKPADREPSATMTVPFCTVEGSST